MIAKMNLCHLGAGAFGAVHKAVWRDCDVAVKLLSNTQNITKVYEKRKNSYFNSYSQCVCSYITESRK
jgi:hypothetical protein